jgi:GTP-binding protein Era
MAIITPKAQTTRHRILGIVNDENYQIVFSDTPGIIKPSYKLQENMMHFVDDALVDADILVFVTDINEKQDEEDVIEKLKKTSAKVLVVINKIDESQNELIEEKINYWREKLNPEGIVGCSALHAYNVEPVMSFIIENLPVHPPYYEKDELTDRSERFFVSEMIREKIFKFYKKEIPYSTEVIITSFKDGKDIIKISAEIVVERDSQKNILIGTGGVMLKKVGTYARQDMEEFLHKKVFLEMFVKVIPDWRNRENYLKSFGYSE